MKFIYENSIFRRMISLIFPQKCFFFGYTFSSRNSKFWTALFPDSYLFLQQKSTEHIKFMIFSIFSLNEFASSTTTLRDNGAEHMILYLKKSFKIIFENLNALQRMQHLEFCLTLWNFVSESLSSRIGEKFVWKKRFFPNIQHSHSIQTNFSSDYYYLDDVCPFHLTFSVKWL